MGKSSGKAPDVVGAARETGEQSFRLNEAQTAANRPNQTNAWGSTSWDSSPVWNPVTGSYENQWSQTETLNPHLQQQLDQQMRIGTGRGHLAEGAMARAYEDYQNPMDFDQFGGPEQFSYDKLDFDPNVNRQQAEDAAYQRSASRLDPQFDSREQALQTKLRNQGLSQGDQAYDAAIANFGRQRNDAYEMARLGATGEGRTESQQAYQQALGTQGQQFGQSVQQNQIANALRTQNIQESLAKRGYNMDEVERLLQGQQIKGGPPTSGGQTESSSNSSGG